MGSVETKSKATWCLQAIREVPLQAYRLPTDGRKWASDCRLRLLITLHLASRADADGGSIFPSAATVAKAIGISRRTVNYVFDDLRTLKFLKDEGFSSSRYKHTRIRRLDIAAILKAGGTVVQDSRTVVQYSPNGCAGLEETVVQDSPEKHHETHESCTQPTKVLTTHPTTHPTVGGLEGWKKKNLATMGVENKAAQQWLEQQVETYTESIVVAALEKYLQRPNGFFGVKNPWILLQREFPAYVEKALQESRDAAVKAKLDAATEVLVRQQMTDHAAFLAWDKEPDSECEPEIDG